jgi:ribosome maturation factor RimP
MQEKLDELKKNLSEVLQKKDIIVDEVIYVTEGKYNFLRITLDKVNGIDLDTIVDATNIINPIIDKYDFIDEEFILDVISKEKGDYNG